MHPKTINQHSAIFFSVWQRRRRRWYGISFFFSLLHCSRSIVETFHLGAIWMKKKYRNMHTANWFCTHTDNVCALYSTRSVVQVFFSLIRSLLKLCRIIRTSNSTNFHGMCVCVRQPYALIFIFITEQCGQFHVWDDRKGNSIPICWRNIEPWVTQHRPMWKNEKKTKLNF